MVTRVALAGAGRFGTLHLRAFCDLPARIVAVCDPDPEQLRRVQQEFGIPRSYPTLDELLAHEDIDLVDVTSDEASHGTLVLRALDAGCHVLVEKPLTLDAAQAETIRARARERDRCVITGQISRFGAGYQHLRDIITAGELGQVVNLRFRRDFSRSWFPAFGHRVHPVWESGIHDVDLALWLAGAPCHDVYAVQRNVSGLPYPDTFSAVLTFTNGVVATIESAWLVPDAAPQTLRGSLDLDGTIDAFTEVLGDRGTAGYRLAHDGLSVRTDRHVSHPELTLWPTVAGTVSGALRAELDHTLKVVREEHDNDVIPLHEAVEGVRVCDAIIRSATRRTRLRLSPAPAPAPEHQP